MYKEKNLPEALRDVIEKWDQEDKVFFIGPENFSSFHKQKILYKISQGISSELGFWYAKSVNFQDDSFPELSRDEIEDIAVCLIKYYRPSSWTIILDYHCNYSCPMCPYYGKGYVGDFWKERKRLKRVVPLEEAYQYIDKLYNNGIKSIGLSSSGELFLYPFWKEVASYAFKKGIYLSTITNGSMINESICQTMREVGIKRVDVSLDGLTFEVYSKVRSNKQEHYKAALNSPLLLKKYGFEVGVQFVQQRENLHETAAFIDYWKNTNVDSINISYQTKYHDGYSTDVLGLEKEVFIHGLCAWFGGYVILPDGTVTGCCEMQLLYKDNDSYGLPRINFLETPYDEIINGINNLLTKLDSPLKTICQNCSLYSLPSVNIENHLEWTVSISKGKEYWQNNDLMYLKKEIDNILNDLEIEKERLLIYGSGLHTEKLIKHTNLLRANIIGIADKDENKQGKNFYGFTVISPAEITQLKPDSILISSKSFEDEIYNELIYLKKQGINLVKIYS